MPFAEGVTRALRERCGEDFGVIFRPLGSTRPIPRLCWPRLADGECWGAEVFEFRGELGRLADEDTRAREGVESIEVTLGREGVVVDVDCSLL